MFIDEHAEENEKMLNQFLTSPCKHFQKNKKIKNK